MGMRVAIAGASGYAGGELLRLLAGHPDLDVVTVTAHSSVGRRLGDVQPHLRTYGDLPLLDTTPETLAGHDVVFLALPHGPSGAIAAQLDPDVLVVDAGAGHRGGQAARRPGRRAPHRRPRLQRVRRQPRAGARRRRRPGRADGPRR